MADQKVSKVSNCFFCEKCDYKCSKQSLWDKHKMTAKHRMADPDLLLDLPVSPSFRCDCGKIYKHKQSLFKHKKDCISFQKQEQLVSKDENTTDLIMMLIQQNKELQSMLVNQAKEYNDSILKVMQHTGNNHSNNANNSYNTNSHNKTFNLQFFLNETCKNALNMSEFISNLKLTLEDLEETGSKGYVEGISNIFIKGLQELDVTERPIHCSDIKRETIYIKDNDKWDKDDEERPKTIQSIKQITHKNMGQIYSWQQKYPDYNNPESRDSDKYQKMIYNTMSGSSKEECTNNYNKIIKNIAKEVVIQKN